MSDNCRNDICPGDICHRTRVSQDGAPKLLQNIITSAGSVAQIVFPSVTLN